MRCRHRCAPHVQPRPRSERRTDSRRKRRSNPELKKGVEELKRQGEDVLSRRAPATRMARLTAFQVMP